MQLTSVAIFGASGYSGIELAKLCATHPALEVKLLTSDRWVGEDAAVRLGSLAGLSFVGHDDGLARAKECAVAFLATALLAFGRTDLGAAARLFAAGFGEERRATVRDAERLKLLVTALISKVMIERAMWT